MWRAEDQLLNFSYVNSRFIMLSPVTGTDMSKLFDWNEQIHTRLKMVVFYTIVAETAYILPQFGTV